MSVVIDLQRERVKRQLLEKIKSSKVKLIRPLTEEDIEKMVDKIIAGQR